ncbi:efflux pump antibiotic resistance protein [Periconia macrospinosa]|uniref:Efflux pump antibiotic resistance protein n=1 Tax=Periconia macrospinosa TaxID=97972 RepID=A0A2V1DMS9_9PLEO|nr:efflux pump antibiotic resistance protein [Periconia macrospinosa]
MDNGVGSHRELKGLRWTLVIVAVLSPTFLYALDNTVMANVRPSIIDTFGQLDMITWLSVAYPMGELGANPLWGKLNHYFDSKLLYLFAVFVFEVGSAVNGSAQSMEAVIVGRAIAGAGGSGVYVGTINIITAMTTPSERAQYLNYVAMSWSLGTVLGPVVGGAFADSPASWRWAFYLNICVAAVSVPICLWLVPTKDKKDSTSTSILSRLKKIDYLGAFLFLGGVVSIIIILGSGGADYDWNSGEMIALYVVTCVLWIAFSLQQGFNVLTVDRIFPVQLAADWEMVILFCWTALAIANVVVTIYSLPLFFQFTFGDSSLMSAVYMLPFIMSIVVSAGIGGPLFSRYPIYMPWFTGASILMLVANGLLSSIDFSTSRGKICGYTVLQGFGVGPVAQLGYTVGQTKASRAITSQVTAFLTCAQMAGLALSLGITTCVFLNYATDDISAIIPDAGRDFIQATINGVRTGLLQSLSATDRVLVQQAIARDIVKGFYMNIAGAGLGLLTSLVMRRERLLM